MSQYVCTVPKYRRCLSEPRDCSFAIVISFVANELFIRIRADTFDLQTFEKKHTKPISAHVFWCFMCRVHGVRFQHVTAIFNAEISRSKLQKNEDEIDAKPETREGQFR